MFVCTLKVYQVVLNRKDISVYAFRCLVHQKKSFLNLIMSAENHWFASATKPLESERRSNQVSSSLLFRSCVLLRV